MIKRFVLSLFCVLLMGWLLFLSIGCGAPQKQTEDDVFRYNQAEGIETLDPAFARNLAVMWGVHFIYNTLIEVDSELNLQPSLAKSWEVSPDNLTYTFHLQNDVYFQDNAAFPNGKGRKMTAEDIVYSFQRLIDPQTAAAGAWVFHDRIADQNPFEAVDDSTFVLRLKRPFRPILGILSMPYCSIVPHEVGAKWGKDFRNHPCGTGPFQFAFWDEGNLLTLHANPHYWEKDEKGRQLPYLKGIEVSFNETRVMEFLRFQQNELDFMNGIDGAIQDLVLTKKGTLRPQFKQKIRLKKLSYLNTEYIGFLLDSTLNNSIQSLKVRQAINYAIDRQKIITYFRNGIGIPATKGFIPPGLPGIHYPQNGYEFNPTKAAQLLKEAGFPEGRGLTPIELSSPDKNLDICTFVAKELNNIGIPVTVRTMQNGLLHQQMSASKLDFFKAQWIADYPDPETFFAFFYSPLPAPPNYTRFQNRLFDRWYEQSIRESNPEKRDQIYSNMDSLINVSAPIVPLYYGEILHFTHPNVHGVVANPLNMIDLKRAYKR